MRVAGQQQRSAPVSFKCTPSDSEGYLRISQTDPRYLQLDSGRGFFGIGHNLAFVKDVGRTEDMFARLGKAGGNFTRIWACSSDWAMCIEGPKSAWGRSWGQRTSPVAVPGAENTAAPLAIRIETGARITAQPSHPVAVKGDVRYVLSGEFLAPPGSSLSLSMRTRTLGSPIPAYAIAGQWTSFRIPWTSAANQMWLEPISLSFSGPGTLYLRSLSLREEAGGADLLWEADPNRPRWGVYNQIDSFMLDKIVEAGEREGIYMMVVVLMRDLYWGRGRGIANKPGTPAYDEATAYARNLLRYAVARWGYSTHLAMWEYFNEIDPGAPTNQFYDDLGRYLEQIDIYRHIRATSTWGPSPKDWVQPRLDVSNLHPYMRNVDSEPWRDETLFVLSRGRQALASTPTKPVLMSEFGLADRQFRLSPYIAQDKQNLHIRNAAWVSVFSGLAATPMSWWWDELHQQDVYRQYTPLAAFVADIPFGTIRFPTLAQVVPDQPHRVLGLVGPQQAYLWIADTRATWYNQAIEKMELEPMRGTSVQVPGLAPGAYRVQWWDTQAGKVMTTEQATVRDGVLRLTVPTFTGDIACKVLR